MSDNNRDETSGRMSAEYMQARPFTLALSLPSLTHMRVYVWMYLTHLQAYAVECIASAVTQQWLLFAVPLATAVLAAAVAVATVASVVAVAVVVR